MHSLISKRLKSILYGSSVVRMMKKISVWIGTEAWTRGKYNRNVVVVRTSLFDSFFKSLLDLNESLILSSYDDDSNKINSRKPISSTRWLYSSLTPSSGKVGASMNENTCRVEQQLSSIPANSELTHSHYQGKKEWNDRFDNSFTITSLQCHKRYLNKF